MGGSVQSSSRSCLTIAFLGLLASADDVRAQAVQRGVTVADRPRPQYDPIGFDLGTFRVYPAISTDVRASDNYRARDTDRQGDFFAVVLPEVAFGSTWGRHRLNGRAYFNRSIHANLPTENASQYGVLIDGAYEVSRDTVLRADASLARSVEGRADLGSFRNSVEPVRFDTYHVAIGGSQQFNRVRLDGSVGVNKLIFKDVDGLDGSIIDQSFRDVRTISESLSAQYDVGNGIGLIVSGSANQNRFSFRPGSAGFNPLINLNRDSSGFSLEGGVVLELSSLVFGTIKAGYIRQDYRDARLRDFSGLSFTADVNWNVTSLTTLRFRASRTVQDTSSTAVAGNTRSDFSLRVDHELYRFLILSSTANYATFTPNGPGARGTEYGIQVGARYLIDRHWSVGLNAGYAHRDSASTFLRYRAASAALSIRFAL